MATSGMSSTRRILMFLNRFGLPKAMIRFVGRAQGAWLPRVGGRGPFSTELLVLTTRGRVSGRPHAACLLYLDDGPHRYVVGSFAGSDRPPNWYLNLVADPRVSVDVRGVRTDVVARVLTADEADAVWPALDAYFPPFADYRAHVTRRIPVVELAAS